MADMILQQEIIKASAAKIYAALSHADIFSDMTRAPADLSDVAGAEFSLFGGYIIGRNIELVENIRIVQAWRSKAWDDGVYSVVNFSFEETDGQTLVKLVHSGFPADQKPHLEQGWYRNYWDNLTQKFNQG